MMDFFYAILSALPLAFMLTGVISIAWMVIIDHAANTSFNLMVHSGTTSEEINKSLTEYRVKANDKRSHTCWVIFGVATVVMAVFHIGL